MPVMAPVMRPGSGAGPRPSTPERYPGASHAVQPSPPAIEPRLKKAEAAAGTPKMWRVLRMPIATAASATRRRKGNMMRVSATVSSTLPGMSAKPGAMAVTSAGANQMPASVMAPTTIASAFTTRLASRQAAASPSCSRRQVKVVTKAAESAPSANRSRSRFGMRKAVMKASSSRPAPKKTANACSRTSPRTRLTSTAALTTPARRASCARPPASTGAAAAALSSAPIAPPGSIREGRRGRKKRAAPALARRGLRQARARRTDRQPDAEGAPGAGRALDVDPPAVGRHHRVTHREPEPRPAAHVLGGEEGVEDAAEDGGRDAGPVVADRDAHRVALGARHDPDVTRARDRVAGVGEQVHEHLVELARVALDGGERAVIAVDGDARAPARLEGAERHLEPLVQVDRFARGLAETGEAAQILHDRRRARRPARHDAGQLLGVAERPPRVRWGAGRRLLETAGERRDAVRDEAHGVVDLVRHAGDQAAERGHLLGVDEPGLGALQLAVGLGQLAVRLLELRRALVHAVLQAGVRQGQRLVRACVLERDRRLLGEGAQELGVPGRVEEPRPLGARGEDAHQLAAQAKGQGDLRAERGERRAYRLVRRRVGVELGRVVDGDDATLVEGAAEGRRHAPAAAGLGQPAVRRAHEEAGGAGGDRMVDGRAHQGDDALPRERWDELPADGRELACAVVGGAEEDAVDEGLEAGAERVEDEEDDQGEEDG